MVSTGASVSCAKELSMEPVSVGAHHAHHVGRVQLQWYSKWYIPLHRVLEHHRAYPVTSFILSIHMLAFLIIYFIFNIALCATLCAGMCK